MESVLNEAILLVDDEPNLLEGLRRQFRGKFNITTAGGGAEGLKKLDQAGPFAVVVSDMRMPEMDGVQFLRRAQTQSPNTVRIMLTGNSDIDTAVHAVNEGNIFRFLLKPCAQSAMEMAIRASIEQHRLIIAERELLDKTLHGSVQVLADILALLNPAAFSRASRLKDYVCQIARLTGYDGVWHLEIAALLSQIGCVSVPQDTLRKIFDGEDLSPEENEMYRSHPKFGGELLARIPRLERVARIISLQLERFPQGAQARKLSRLEEDLLGGQILKAAIDLDTLISGGLTSRQALTELNKRKDEYDPSILPALEAVNPVDVEMERKVVKLSELNNSMFLEEDICTELGMLVATSGQQITISMRKLLRNLLDRQQIKDSYRIRIPKGSTSQTPSARAASPVPS